jgi:hypothetical protein
MSCISVGFHQKDMKRVLYFSWVLPEGHETCSATQWLSVRRRIPPRYIYI